MARNKIGLKFEGFEEYIAKLDQLGGSDAMRRGVESALKASKQYVNPKINVAMSPSNLPAKGKYQTGRTKSSIDTDMRVEWDGQVGSIKIGFDFDKSGVTSIFLMYGTPRMNPARGLKASIYGSGTKKEIAKIQEEAVTKAIQRIMGS